MKTHWGRIAGRLLVAFLALGLSLGASAEEARFAAGAAQIEFRDPGDSSRPIDVLLTYPVERASAKNPLRIPLSAHLQLFADAPAAAGGRRPLVVFSHGAGGNASGYAWFGQYLAERGFVVAMAYHYRANTFDSSALYVRNRLWRRPLDLSLIVTHLLDDPLWGPRLDGERIGVAGHSQGGFTALWIGGAEVDPLCSKPINAPGSPTMRCRPTCATRWRSTPRRRGVFATPASRPPSRWRREICKVSA